MKTLNNYVVTGALYVSDSGPEASVGDQVRLFLDIEAEPGFPEYVVGVIQHPIVRVQCNSATSYSIEYDEAELDGAKAFLIPDDVVDAAVVTQLDVLEDSIAALFQSGTFSNASGDSTITIPDGCEHYTIYGTFTGSAGTRNIVLDTTGVAAGCRVVIVLNLPATSGIIVNFYNTSLAGTLLDTITTDTSGDDASAEFGFTTAWNKIQSNYPN